MEHPYYPTEIILRVSRVSNLTPIDNSWKFYNPFEKPKDMSDLSAAYLVGSFIPPRVVKFLLSEKAA